jgi:hypothetical protein
MIHQDHPPANVPISNEELAYVRNSYKRVDPLSGAVLLLICPAFLVLLLIPEIWPASAIGKGLAYSIETDILQCIFGGLFILSATFLPVERKRVELAEAYAAILHYDRAVKLFGSYHEKNDMKCLAKCHQLIVEALPYLAHVPEVLSFAAAVNQALDSECRPVSKDKDHEPRA